MHIQVYLEKLDNFSEAASFAVDSIFGDILSVGCPSHNKLRTGDNVVRIFVVGMVNDVHEVHSHFALRQLFASVVDQLRDFFEANL